MCASECDSSWLQRVFFRKIVKEVYNLLHCRRDQSKDLLYPCIFIKSGVAPFQKRSNDYDARKLVFDKFIRVTKGAYSYTTYNELEKLAEFGGYVGLFLGFSVFQVSQVVEKCLHKLINKKLTLYYPFHLYYWSKELNGLI